MTQGHDPVIDSNGLPGHHTTAPGTEPVVSATFEPTQAVEAAAGRTSRIRRPAVGMRGSTMLLMGVWVAVLVLYLAVRPGG
ncbi:hypothetical protein [Nocardia spumae]|uniref:hypothetical protein n=1 Tax=Nocardia spumae TaxID=2887190 RepID=UPI001D15C610|nr:hypothetical protein [Nocardia spumae]